MVPLCLDRAITVIVEVKREIVFVWCITGWGCTDFCLKPALWHSLLALGCGWEALVSLVRRKFQVDVTKSSLLAFYTLTSSFKGSFNPANILCLKPSAFPFSKSSFKS